MGEVKDNNKEEKKEKKKLSVDSTVLLSVAGVAIFIIVARIIYYLVTGV